tara:strand:- start:244 stop:438 length:195 start_codon:yes stop_codon:yes gene_type:complete
MNRELQEDIKEEIKETMSYFDDNEHFQSVFDQSGFNDENLRIFDCGFVRGLKYVLNKLQENNEE